MTVIINTPVAPVTGRYGAHPTEGTAIELRSNHDFLSQVLGSPKRFHYASRDKLHVVHMPVKGWHDAVYNGADYEVGTVSLGIQAVHQAFAAHVPLCLRPDTLWYIIVHEVAEFVRQHPADYAHLFTDTPEAKQRIVVRDDSLRPDAPSDWMHAINLFRKPLAEKLSDNTAELFLPRFSTSTIEDETALLVALMDVASPYYEFGMQTMCGIPQIRLEGLSSDWYQLHQRTEELARVFPGLADYFADLLPVLQTIAKTADGALPNDEFWRSIYKYGGGSGGPYVNGWITAFFAFVQTRQGAVPKERFNWAHEARSAFGGFSTNEFPSHVTRVPFVWNYLGTEFDMAFAAGITGVDDEDGFLTPRLGFAVVEV